MATIRTATLDDLPVLKQFEQGIIAAERPYDSLLRPDPISYYDLADLIAAEDAVVMVAEVDGAIAASGYAKRRASRPYTEPAFHAFLGFMFVLPEHRGRGLNGKLLDALLEWSREHGLTEIRLTVYPGNEPAVRAYEKAGFSPYLVEMRRSIGPQD